MTLSTRARYVTATLWLLLGVIGGAVSVAEAIKLGMSNQGAFISTVIAISFCAGTIIVGLAVLRGWPAAWWLLLLFGAILALYSIAFVVMVSLEFGALWYCVAWLGIILGIASCFVGRALKNQGRSE